MSNYYTMETTQELQGREYNSWQPGNTTNNKIHTDANITSNWKYRQYMQKNAKDIMKYNTMQYINASGNNPYTLLNTEPTNNTPYLYTSVHDTKNPSYGFTDSDLKQDYLQKIQIKSRMIAPTISTNF